MCRKRTSLFAPSRAQKQATSLKCRRRSRIDADALVCYVFDYVERSEQVKRRAIRTTRSSASSHKLMKNKALKSSAKAKAAPPDPLAPAKQAQMKFYEEALKYFQQQKFQNAKQSLERVLEGPSKELGDRAKSTCAFATSGFPERQCQ